MIKIINIELVLKFMDSNTKSLEKYPLILGIPNKFKIETFIIKVEKGVYTDPLDKYRISWLWFILIIISPIVINSKDLNKAWTSKWKNLKWSNPEENDIAIKPKCLSVDKAISFFKSISNTVFIPA